MILNTTFGAVVSDVGMAELCSGQAVQRLCNLLRRAAAAPCLVPNTACEADCVKLHNQLDLLTSPHFVSDRPHDSHPSSHSTSLKAQGISLRPVAAHARSSKFDHIWSTTRFSGPLCCQARRCYRQNGSVFAHFSTQGKPSVVTFPLAQTGEGISECELVEWAVKEGDEVSEFDQLCEVQSDKASINITSRYSGKILKLHHAKGDVVKVGGPLVDIQVLSAAVDQLSGSSSSDSSDSDEEDARSKLATVIVTSDPVADIANRTEAEFLLESAVVDPASILATPAVRRIAREHGILLSEVAGTGCDGRIMKEDVLRYIERKHQTTPKAASSIGAGTAGHSGNADDYLLDALRAESVAVPGSAAVPIKVPIRGYQRAMVKSMTAATAIPHFHFMDEVCMEGLSNAREVLKNTAGLAGAKLTFMPFVIKAVSAALAEHSYINASLAPDASYLEMHPHHNIGIAMATPAGLVVPNIKQVELLSIQAIALELASLQELAKLNKLASEHLTGGTITVSNIGSVGGTYAAPLVNPPEAAIVALGRVRRLPRYGPKGGITETGVMNVSWGADHRVVDGASLAAFSNTWKQYMEQPLKLLMQLK